MPSAESLDAASAKPAVLALADDATGALEVGAQFASCGIQAAVAFRPVLTDWPHADAVVIDTETRHLPAEAAADIVSSLAEQAGLQHIRFVFKKTDSTLRGNIAAEFGGLLAAVPGAPLIYVPAYPKLGRHVREGRLLVNGVALSESSFAGDRQSPSRVDCIKTLLAPELDVPVRNIKPADLPACLETRSRAVWVCDSEQDADLETIGAAVAAFPQPCLVAGAGAFAGVWARRLPLPGNFAGGPLPRGGALVVNGSLHPASLAQVERCGWRFPLPEERADDLRAAAEAAEEIRLGGWAVITSGPEIKTGPSEMASRLANVACRVLALTGVRTLIVVGGDTTAAVARELGVQTAEPQGEMLDGVPVSFITIAGKKVSLVTKAGGFGGPDTLENIRSILERA